MLMCFVIFPFVAKFWTPIFVMLPMFFEANDVVDVGHLLVPIFFLMLPCFFFLFLPFFIIDVIDAGTVL